MTAEYFCNSLDVVRSECGEFDAYFGHSYYCLFFDEGLNLFLLNILFAVRSQERNSSTDQEEKELIDLKNHFFGREIVVLFYEPQENCLGETIYSVLLLRVFAE